MPNVIRTAFLRTATLLALAAAVQADENRPSVTSEMKQHQLRLKSASRDRLIRGEFRDIANDRGYDFRLMASSTGETFVERTIDNGPGSDPASRSIALITPAEAVHIVRTDGWRTPSLRTYRPDGMGSYARLTATLREGLVAAADACWSVHGAEVAALLDDPRVTIENFERIDFGGDSVVRIRFDSSAAPWPFDRGELHFRPDRAWAISQTVLEYPAANAATAQRRETWKIRPEYAVDGSVIPAQVEKTVEYVNRHDMVKTRVTFHDRTTAFDHDQLFDSRKWLAELSAPPPPPIESGADEDAPTAYANRLSKPESNQPVSKQAARIMKFASPASGVLTVLILASLFERYRDRGKPNREIR